MSEAQSTLFPLEFNRSVKIECRRERLSADGAALLLRDLLHRLELDEWLAEHLRDPRDPARTTHPAEELLRTLLLLQGQGWTDQDDVDLLRHDPIFRLAVSSRRQDRAVREARTPSEPEGLCSQPTLPRCLQWLSVEPTLQVLDRALREAADRRHRLRSRPPLEEATLDLDSLPVEVHGHQPGSAYNGHFGVRCYHPVVLRWDRGDFLAARLREGNAHTADGALEFALPGIRWARQRARRVWVRIDAGFPSWEFLRGLKAEGVCYVARLRTNEVLKRMAKPHLKRPPGRPPKEGRTWLHELHYEAGPWERERRVVLVVLERPRKTEAEDGTVQERLFLDHFFLITNAPVEEVSAEELLERYRGRGQAEKDFGDWKNALEVRLSSTPRPKTHYRGRQLSEPDEPRRDSFAVNEAWLLVSLLAANLLDLLRELSQRVSGRQRSRERVRNRLLKTPVRITLGSRRMKVILGATRARLWRAFREEMIQTYPVRRSPGLRTRPLPA